METISPLVLLIKLCRFGTSRAENVLPRVMATQVGVIAWALNMNQLAFSSEEIKCMHGRLHKFSASSILIRLYPDHSKLDYPYSLQRQVM